MTKTLRWLTVAGIVLLGGYAVMLVVWPDSRPSLQPPPPRADESAQHSPRQKPYAEIPAEILIPSAAECGELSGCPKTRLGIILGVDFSNPHGLTVGSVEPDGPAAKAGVQPGDLLARPGDCPSSTIDHFLPAEECRTISVTIRRWENGGDATAADADTAAAADSEAEPPSEDQPEPPS